MYRILLAEDMKDTRELLRERLERRIPGAKVDVAATVGEALRLIEEAAIVYAAAVLDFKLPQERGGNPEVDESLCQKLHADALVVHITAYPDDPAIIRHMAAIHARPKRAQAEIVSKLEVDWLNQLVPLLKAYLYGRRIEERLTDLVGGEWAAESQRPERRLRRGGRGRGLTHELADLFREIKTYWPDLDPEMQQRIKDTFHVDATSEPIRISLMHIPRRADETGA